MRKILFLFALLLCGCASTHMAVDNSEVFKQHQSPYKIFGIGKWDNYYSVLTLVDANSKYFTVKTLKNDALRVGDTYATE